MKHRFLLLLIILAYCIPDILSQEENLDSLLEVIVFEDDEMVSLLTGKKNYQFLYARTHFENRSYFSGRDIGIEQQNYSAQLSYFHSAGINIAVGSIWYSQFNPKLYATSLTLGYSGKFGKSNDYRYRGSYNRYFFSKMDSVDSHAFNNAFALGATIDKGLIGTRLDLALLTGEETAGQVSWDLFADITLIKLGTFDRIKFEPEISFFLGKEIMAYYELGAPGQNQEYIQVEDSEFGLLNMSFRFPLIIDYKNLDLEIAYNINRPNSMLSEEKLPVTTYFSASLGYIFSLN
ncbi:MAG: hypothetical protein U9R60_06300 [Bacteroidota bacterium]|nr:hypothetical protein [Bacteroidota bacterium]